jgi:hypothetical protein
MNLARRWWCGAFAVAALVAAVGLSPPRAAAAKPAFLSGQVYLDGEAPVAGSAISVRAGRPQLPPRSGRPVSKTYRTGAFSRRLRGLPRTLTLSASGGRTDSGKLEGSLAAYVPAGGSLRVVYVNPATTLLAAYIARHPRVGFGRAQAIVKRFLGIPPWHDLGADLIDSSRYFDGATFAAQARRRGGLQPFVQDLVRDLGPQTKPHRFRSKQLQLGGQIEDLIEQLAKSALGFGAKKYAGWLLSQYGIGDGVAGQIEELKSMLQALSAQLAETRADVLRGQCSIQAHQQDQVLGNIDKAQEYLGQIARLPKSDSTLPGLTQIALRFIEANLQGAQNTLNQALVLGAPPADSMLVACSRAVKHQVGLKFWDSRTSGLIERFLGYFQSYEGALLNSIVEWQHANPQAFSGNTVLEGIETTRTQLAQQRAVLKPAPDPRVVIDIGTRLMWARQFGPCAPFLGRGCRTLEDAQQLIAKFNAEGRLVGFRDWRLPTIDELKGLVVDAGIAPGSGPTFPRLAGEPANIRGANTSLPILSSSYEEGHDPIPTRLQCMYIDTTVFARSCFQGGDVNVMFVRTLGPNESYWYE